MTGLSQFTYLMLLLALICLPAVLLIKLKNIYASTLEAILKGGIVGFCQFFLVALGLFYCKVPVSLAGWAIAYLANIVLTVILWKTVKPGAAVASFRQDKVFWMYFSVVIVILLAFTFETMRKTVIMGDSSFYWFLRGWTFANAKDLYAFPYVWTSMHPLIIPLIYSIFLQTNCVLGVAGYTAVLMSVLILMILVIGWNKAGKLSVILGVPLSVYLPVFFNDHYYTSYADIPFAIMFCAALIFLADSMFEKKTSYPAIVLLSFVVMMRPNGTFMVFVTALIAAVYLYNKESGLKSVLSVIIKIFALPFIMILIFNRILKYTYESSIVNKYFVSTILDEFINSPDGFVNLWNKTRLIIDFYFATASPTPYNYIYFAPLMFLLVFWRISRKEAFILSVTMLIIFIYVFPLSLAVTNNEMQTWFNFSFARWLFHCWPAMTAVLYFVCLDFINKIKSIPKE